jgi:hypothetical protein
MTKSPWQTGAVFAAALLSACSSLAPTPGAVTGRPLACDDGLKTAFRPDATTTVVAVRRIKAGEQITAVDS